MTIALMATSNRPAYSAAPNFRIDDVFTDFLSEKARLEKIVADNNSTIKKLIEETVREDLEKVPPSKWPEKFPVTYALSLLQGRTFVGVTILTPDFTRDTMVSNGTSIPEDSIETTEWYALDEFGQLNLLKARDYALLNCKNNQQTCAYAEVGKLKKAEFSRDVTVRLADSFPGERDNLRLLFAIRTNRDAVEQDIKKAVRNIAGAKQVPETISFRYGLIAFNGNYYLSIEGDVPEINGKMDFLYSIDLGDGKIKPVSENVPTGKKLSTSSLIQLKITPL